jgi:hypothetical protein
VSVAGRPDWLFVKVHCHGARQQNWPALLGPAAERMHRHLHQRYNDGARWRLHYVTAREVYNAVKAAERGMRGDPGQYRDLELAPPPAGRTDATSRHRRKAVP